MDLTKRVLNITQLKTVVKNSILDLDDFLSGEIRTVGLRDKSINRLETLNKIQTILAEHEDVKQYETTCAGCGCELRKDHITQYCINCL